MKRTLPSPERFFKSFLFFVILATASPVFAQPWIKDDTSTKRKNFYDIQRQFNEYWKDRPVEKGKGWKPFKRWEWFWEQRVAPTGEFPNPMQLLMERPVLKDKKDKADKVLNVTNPWSPLGPVQASGGYYGLGRINCITVNPSNSNIIWIGSASGGAWRSTNGGSSWSNTTDKLPTLGVGDIAIDPSNTNTMYLATGDGDGGNAYSVGVLKSTDGGATWNTTGLNYNITQTVTMSRMLIHPTTTTTLLVAASNGIYRSTNGGTNWTQEISGSFKDMEFKPGDPSIVYAGRSNGAIFRSTDGGDSWTQITSGLPTSNAGRISIAVSPANSNFVYALFSNTNSGFLGLYSSTNSGLNWTLMSNTPNILHGGDGSGEGGQGWYDLSLAVSPTNEYDIYTGGINIWRSEDGGSTWTKKTHWHALSGFAEVHADQHFLYFEPSTAVLYLGNDGGIYSSTNNGTTWSWLSNGLQISQFYRIGTSATNSNKYIVGAQDNSTYYFNGSSWTNYATGDGMESAIDPSNENILYISSYYGALQRSTNGGTNFTDIRATTGGSWVTPYVLNPQKPQTIFAGYANVWKSNNRGSTWSQISNFGSGSLNILNVAPSDSNTIYASTGNSNLRRTTNGGTNWTSFSLPSSNTLTYLAIHPTTPLKIWVTFSGYSAGNKVYTSNDGGSSWTNISGTLPNIPANCIVYQNNSPDRLYVGTDVGVYYIDNTLSDWADYNEALPNVVISELEIQYGSGKLRAATYGRGVWETAIISTIITPGSIASSTCAGGTLSIPFTVTGTANSGNIFTAQLSDGNGSFSSPATIGTLSGTFSGTISAVIPQATVAGNSYKVRIVSSNPVVISAPSGSINISAKPPLGIDGADQVCFGTTTRYTAAPQAGIETGWAVTNGEVVGANDKDTVFVRWTTAGPGSIKQIKTVTAGGCKDSIEVNIAVNPSPLPAFTGIMSVCPATSAAYTSLASGEWKATNGTILGASTGTTVVVMWGEGTGGSLKLIQTSASGCKDSLTENITFKNNPAAEITGMGTVCQDDIFTYTAQTFTGVSYQWDVTGGTISGSSTASSLSVAWGNSTVGFLKLIQSDLLSLCSDTAIYPVTISPVPVAAITGNFQNISVGTSYTYSASSNPGGTNLWIAEGGALLSNPTANEAEVLWNTSGNGSLKLIQTNAADCKDTAIEVFQINQAGAVSISGGSSVCENSENPYSVSLDGGRTVIWTAVGGTIQGPATNGSVTVRWNTTGTGFLKAARTVTANGFKDTSQLSVTINSLPLKPTITQDGVTLTSSSPSGNQWFVDGTVIPAAVSQSHTATASGQYSVQVKNGDNCISEISDNVAVTITSTDENDAAAHQITVTPNPANGFITIQCPAHNFEKVQLQLVDITGKEFLKTEMTAGENSFKNSLDIHSVPNGTYFLHIRTASQTYTVKVAVSR